MPYGHNACNWSLQVYILLLAFQYELALFSEVAKKRQTNKRTEKTEKQTKDLGIGNKFIKILGSKSTESWPVNRPPRGKKNRKRK